jgi:curved DNA-binding protein CbpA
MSTSCTAAAYARLHLLPTAPPELVQAAHKVMVKLTHPDSGGSHEAAVLINLAWEVIEADQQQKRKAS